MGADLAALQQRGVQAQQGRQGRAGLGRPGGRRAAGHDGALQSGQGICAGALQPRRQRRRGRRAQVFLGQGYKRGRAPQQPRLQALHSAIACAGVACMP
jgi:hypothetical protein